MDASTIAGAIDELTGSWEPGEGATAQELEEARLSLSEALSSGVSPEAVRAVPAFRTQLPNGGRSAVSALTAEAKATATPAVLPVVRSTTDVDPAAESNLAGMKIARTLGPFVDSLGVTHWVDLIPLPTKVPISSATRGVLGYLVVDKPTATLGSGSIWVAAAAFNLPTLTSGAVGLSFSAGTVEHTGSVTVSNTGVTIGAGGTLTLDLTLAPPTPPAGSPGLGRDAAQMKLTLPAQVKIEFTEAGAGLVAIGDSAATVYGASFTLARNARQPHVERGDVPYLLFPCDLSAPQFSFQTVLSADVVPSGRAGVVEGGWALAITTAPPAQLGAASSAGSLILKLGAGISMQFGGIAAPLSLTSPALALAPGNITIWALNGPRDVRDRLTLWDPAPPPPSLEPAPAQHPSEIDLTIRRGSLLVAKVSTQEELVVAFGTARANVDRPLAADGTRLLLVFASALIAFVRSSTGKSVIVEMSDPAVPQVQSVIALENALLRAHAASTGILHATYSGTRLVGTLELSFTDVEIVPILPDPYASAYVFQLPLSGTVSALDTWTLQPGAALRFSIIPAGTAQPAAEPVPEAAARFGTTLLDISGNADQFGVSFGAGDTLPRSATLDGLALAVTQEELSVYTLPGISWEPVVDESRDDWLNAPSSDDGPPTSLRANTVKLVPVEPDVALPAFAQAAADADTFASFTLPFGLIANLQMTANDPPAQRPSYSLVKADYAAGLSASRQLSIRARSQIKVGDPALPGNTTTGSPLPVPLNSSVYGVLTLGNDPLGAAQFFDQQFSASGVYPQVPVTRIDISGYGTSMFSDWKNDDLSTVGVVRSRFDVLVGRTAYELVQIATVIVPWCIRITRTIIFDRYDTGLVVRHDTGWKATGRGEFALLQPDQQLRGAVDHLENVHNIAVGVGQPITLKPPATTRTLEFLPVTFDADVALAPSVTASSAGRVGRFVAGTEIQGYAQLTVGPVASALEILTAMRQVPDGVSGAIGCIVNVGPAPAPGSPKFTLNVSSLTAKTTAADVAGQTYPAVAVAVHGTPRLPRDGAWSIARRGSADPAPTLVDPTFPIPLIFGTNNDGNHQWRLLDPADALSVRAPNTVFGLLQGTGTSKSLFENPVVEAAGQSLLLDPAQGVPPPNLADIGALLGAADIFPNLANVLKIPTGAGDALNLAQDGFKKTFDWLIEKPDHSFLDDQTLLDLGVVRLVLQYHGPDGSNHDLATHTTLSLDANPPAGSPRWALSLDRLSLAAFVQGFSSDPLLTIHGGFAASETQPAGFNNIKIDYGSALSLVKSIISGLTTLVEAMGGSVDLDVGFSENKLTVHDGFALPTIPLGLGEVRDIAIDLGMAIDIPSHAEFHVGLGSKDKPFTWIVDPLAGTGAIVLGTSGGDLGVFIEAGIGAALAIDVVVASGSASIIFELSISTNVHPFALTAALVGNASVDVLGGLASASLTLAAAITIVPHWPDGLPDPAHPLPDSVDFTAAVAVGIHISICWVISVDFDGSWSLSEDIPLHLPF